MEDSFEQSQSGAAYKHKHLNMYVTISSPIETLTQYSSPLTASFNGTTG